MTLRDALAQSINVPSVEALYLAGIQNSINLAEAMGITSLGNPDQYGLTLVLGGGEVSLLDMTSAYGVFADDGTRNPYTAILEVDDSNGNVLEKYTPHPSQVLNPQSAEEISDILSDDVARTPLYGAHSALYFPGYDVAVKTGTTNDSRDAWSMGYTPDLVLGAWAGNNDDTPMTPNSLSGLIVVPMWSALMNQIIGAYPPDQFVKPQEDDSYTLKPVLRGEWQGGISTLTSSGMVISTTTAATLPYTSIQETLSGGVHSILYWLDKDDPRGSEAPGAASTDPQFPYWEYSVRLWATQHGYQ
jgi:membrane peptidoglycan carboxypeptidase